MDRKNYVYWQEEDMWLGYLEEYPDYKTQGESLDELKENLRDIYHDLSSGNIPPLNSVLSGQTKNKLQRLGGLDVQLHPVIQVEDALVRRLQ